MKAQILPLITQHRLAGLILAAFVLLAVTYSVVTPPFEAGDESRHYAVVKFMADTGRLPVQEPGPAQIHWSHEGNQPPLYYALAAALTFWIDTGDWDDVFWYNPHTTIGNPLRPDNKNITIHPPGEAWPWRNHVLAVHLIRFLSVGMATVTVAAAYAIALSLFRGNRLPAAGAMAITAFNPMFIFISASVNNDNAVIMFVTLALWLMVRAIDSQNPLQQPPLKTAALLGLLIGLGALSKLYALGLLPLAGLALAWLAWRANPRPKSGDSSSLFGALASATVWKNAFLWTLVMAVTVLVVAGWFYARNAILYNGDILALQVMRDTAGQRDEAPTLATIRAEFQGFRIAYWALFGGVNILADEWIYTVLDGVSLVAAAGVVVFAVRLAMGIRPKAPLSYSTLAILLGWYLIMVAGFIGWNITQPAGQGRLLYPAIAAISALGMLGLSWWLPERGQKPVAGLVGAALFTFAAVSPFRYIAPAYAAPPRLTPAGLPADIQPVNFTYAGQMRLLGYKLHTPTVRPAEPLRLTLYWQLLEPVTTNYSIFVHLLGRGRQVVAQRDTYPGGGKWPTTLLAPGDILADEYRITIPPQAEVEHAPTRLLIAAGIYNWLEPGRAGLPVTNAGGHPVDPIIAAARLIPWQWPTPPRSAEAINFFDKATLLSYHLSGDRSLLTLNWQANQPFEADYTVFIQLWQADANRYVTGFDGPPAQGDYPTSLWASGDIIIDTHPLNMPDMPPGNYYLLVGLYNPATGERLPAFAPDGPLPDYAVKVAEFTVPGEK